MLSRRLGGDGQEILVAAHAALSDAFDVGELRVLLLDIVHDLGPLVIGVVPAPAYGEVELTVVAPGALLKLLLRRGRPGQSGQDEEGQGQDRDFLNDVFSFHRALLY
jgi:hypothetical protein